MMVLGEVSETLTFPGEDLSGLTAVREIRDQGRMRVLVNSYTPGLAYRDGQDGPLYGFEIDLARSLARSIFGGTDDVDSHIEYIEAPTPSRLDMLVENEVDMIIANLYDTDERRRTMDFAGQYLSQRYMPLLGKDAPAVDKPSDLAGLRVAVEAGGSDEETLMRIAPDAEIVPMTDPSEWINGMADGTVQVFWTDTTYGPNMASDQKDLRIGTLRAGIGHSAVGLRKGSDELRRFVNDFTAHLLVTGQLGGALRKWGV